jgi:hypothetical protein
MPRFMLSSSIDGRVAMTFTSGDQEVLRKGAADVVEQALADLTPFKVYGLEITRLDDDGVSC